MGLAERSPELPFKLTGREYYGGFKLSDYNISDVIIDPEYIEKDSSRILDGVLQKFVTKRTSGCCRLFVKAGRKNGNIYSVVEPIQEYICSEIGKTLGLDIVDTSLWIIDEYLFDLIQRRERIRKGTTCEYCGYIHEYCECENSIIPIGPRVIDSSPSDSLMTVLNNERKVLVSVTKDFTQIDQTFSQAGSSFEGYRDEKLYIEITETYQNNPDIITRLHQMMIFDYLVGNSDRHGGNFGFLMDNFTTQEYMAPLYDHGLAFGMLLFDDWGLLNEGMHILKRAGGKPFGELGLSCYNAITNGGSIPNHSVNIQSLLAITSIFQPILRGDRYSIINKILKERWENVQKLLSDVQKC